MKVLLTGGSRGIGLAIKSLFEKRHHDVHAPTREELDLHNVPHIQSPNYDVVINNAGINIISDLTDFNYDEDSIMKLNYFSPLHIIKQCIPYMAQQKFGRIVNIGSVWTKLAKPGRSNYAASKCALDSLARSITAEYAKYNILCNTVSPGFIATDMTYKNNTEEELEAIKANVPLGRLGNPNEIAELVYNLAVNNTFITGQNIIIDGGYTCVA
jgi:3-oxoacyl-[acyl-carrier protein] reductase